MKKTFGKIGLVLLAAVVAFGAVACSAPKWSVGMVATGEVSSNGGFLAEKGEYVYFINGVEDYTANNDFGKPVTGSLVVAKKSEPAKAEVVVPKLFTAGDYTAGVTIYGDYVYYATPSAEKDTTGAIATGYLEFYRTKLDGSETEMFTRVNGNGTVYRYLEVGGTVYLVYTNAYDENEDGDTVTSVVCYDTAAKKETTVAQDVASVTYAPLADATTLTALYTKNVKNEVTDSNESYNELYIYTVGKEPVLVASGKNWTGEAGSTSNVTYAVTAVNGGYVFYTVTRAADSDVKTYAVALSEIAKGGENALAAVKLEDTTAATASAAIVSLNEAYASVSLNSKTFLAKYDMLSAEETKYELVAEADISTLFFVEGGYAYYANSSSYLSRIAIDGSAEEEVYTNETISTSWYKPEMADGKIFYANTSSEGQSYIYYVDAAIPADHDPEEAEGKFAGIRSEEDIVALAEYYLNQIPTASVRFSQDEDGNWLTDANGNRYNEAVEEARAFYEMLTKDQQKKVSEDALKLLTAADAVLEATEVFMKLSENPYKDITADTLAAHEKLVADAEAALAALTEDQQIMLKANTEDNLMWRLQEAKERIEDLKD